MFCVNETRVQRVDIFSTLQLVFSRFHVINLARSLPQICLFLVLYILLLLPFLPLNYFSLPRVTRSFDVPIELEPFFVS